MSKHRFVAAVDGMSADQEQKFVAWIRDVKLGWWHWIDNFWLITSYSDAVSVSILRDKIKEVAPGKNNMVIEVSYINWAGFGPNTENRNMFKWIKNTWMTD